MFPLVPDLISDELNLVVALFIGIAFGFILEQAGFSSSTKLAGVFYGYDFTVLRVFFTAGVTAMAGVIIFGAMGWLDTSFIYINPTYVEGAILGGVIMGFGFIIGGYCPGTSVCGAAIGKVDAMFFVGGGLIGVFLFAEGYPLFEELYHAGYLGDLRIYDSLGVAQGIFAALLIIGAVIAFAATTRIERKVRPDGPSKAFPSRRHRTAGIGAVALGVVLIFLPSRNDRIISDVSSMEYLRSHPVKEMSVDELAFRIIDQDRSVQIIDVRNAEAFASLTLPGAVNIPVPEMFRKEFSTLLGQTHVKKVFIADREIDERRAALIADRLGYKNIFVLCDGVPEFIATIVALKVPASEIHQCEFTVQFASTHQPPTTVRSVDIRKIQDTERFRLRASGIIAAMIKASKEQPVKVPKLVKKISGGC